MPFSPTFLVKFKKKTFWACCKLFSSFVIVQSFALKNANCTWKETQKELKKKYIYIYQKTKICGNQLLITVLENQ